RHKPLSPKSNPPSRNCCCKPTSATRCSFSAATASTSATSTATTTSTCSPASAYARLATTTPQAAKLIHTSNLFHTEHTVELALRLTEITGLDRVFFSNSGTEAWEAALKLARAH